jgi:endonuclease/exonuclease/phosphatase family metal-dependent hydrolase
LTEETPHIDSPTPPPKKKLGWFSKIILGLNWFAIAGLFLSLISPFVNPAVFWPLAFFGLFHPAFVVMNFFFLLLWTIRRRKQAYYTLVILLLNIPWYGKQFRFHFSTPPSAPASAFKVMSYNVKLFDLYNWSKDTNTRANMFTLIAKEKPDLLNIQEFYNEDSGAFRNLDSLKKLLSLPFVHVEYTISLRGDDHWGVVTFSKFPIVNTGKIVFNTRNNNICIYTDLLIDKDTIRVYNMHLQSISLGYADMKTLDQLGKGEDLDDEVEGSKNILRRMKRAYIKRAGQSESIANHIAKCPYKLIVCGDFNDTPISYCYRTISSGLQDSFVECGTGFGKSLAGFGNSFVDFFPFPRIDYIFHSPSMHAFEYKTIQEKGLSDHYPVVCKISK